MSARRAPRRRGAVEAPAPNLGDVLRKALAGTPLAQPLRGWQAVERWPEIVGPRIAGRTEAVEFREGQLVVEVRGATWLAEMVMLRRTLLLQVHKALGHDVVTAIRFVQAPSPGAPVADGQDGTKHPKSGDAKSPAGIYTTKD